MVCQTTDVTNDDWMVRAERRRLAGRPTHLASTQDVDVDMVDRLASVLSVIDDNPVAFRQTRVFGALLCN